MKLLLEIYCSFFKVGATTFGGGYAMLPILQKEVVEKKKWVNDSDILDYYAISQCTPGIIAVNTSTYIGYQINGIKGAVASALGVLTPSVIVISLIAALFKNFSSLAIVQHAFNGIQVAVAVIIINAVLKMCKTALIDPLTIALFIIALLIFIIFDLSPIIAVIIAIIIGAVFGGKKK